MTPPRAEMRQREHEGIRERKETKTEQTPACVVTSKKKNQPVQ